MTTTQNKLYAYRINSDADSMTVDAGDINEAARKYTANGNLAKMAGVDPIQTVDDLIEAIESIEGAWLWIESDEAPDGNRQYANPQNV